MKARLDRLEVLRAFACLGVFTFHAYITLLGACSVSIFIILSGFLLTYNGLDRADSLPRGFKGCALYSFNKMKKLYPLYFLTLLVLALRIFLLAPENPDMEQVRIFQKQFVFCTLLIQSWLPNVDWAFAFNAVGWYLSTSLLLYFCFPAILRRVKRIRSTGRAIAGMAAIYVGMSVSAALATALYLRFAPVTWPEAGNFQQWLSYVFPIFRLGDFTIGCILGWLFCERSGKKAVSTASATAAEAASIALLIISQLLFSKGLVPDYFMYTMLFVPASCALIYTFATARGHISRLLDVAPVRLIAAYSVEIFLINFAVIKYASPFSTLLPLRYELQQLVFICFTFGLTLAAVIIWRRLSRRIPVLSLR